LALDRQFFSSFFKKNTAQHHPEKHQQFGFRLNHFLSLAEIFSALADFLVGKKSQRPSMM
jgi:hypothetical protein